MELKKLQQFSSSRIYKEELKGLNAQQNFINCHSSQQVLTPTPSSLTFEVLDSQEAALFLKVSVPTLRNMCSNGQVPYFKLGKRNRFRRQDLEALLLKNRRGPK